VLDNDKLRIVKTANAENPITQNLKPLLVVDVWEHAYYLDFQNRRPDYLTTFVDKLINWDFVNSQL
ncbi:MAG TPA: superoxide dismutase [Fe], partial [Caldithrix sp.]|nr:superoxide dismutase [Fe] [Caldithrix sp.]